MASFEDFALNMGFELESLTPGEKINLHNLHMLHKQVAILGEISAGIDSTNAKIDLLTETTTSGFAGLNAKMDGLSEEVRALTTVDKLIRASSLISSLTVTANTDTSAAVATVGDNVGSLTTTSIPVLSSATTLSTASV